MSRPDGWRHNYGVPSEIPAPRPVKPSPAPTPIEVKPPAPATVALPTVLDMFSALKRRAHRDGAPVNFEGGFQA